MGIRNTHNLITKIKLVEKGISHASILDNYQIECYPDSKFIIKQSLFMGKMLFNIKPHINLLRTIVHFLMVKGVNPLIYFLLLFLKQSQCQMDLTQIRPKRISYV